ncbi:MAG TPA: ATPase F0F1, partial [Nitrospiraceae bacterium]|nr:ATPase F0F1 [Nitrospiraceae bacterium]
MEPEKPLFRQLIEASSVGINLVISTFVGLAIGYWLDKLFGTSPYLT